MINNPLLLKVCSGCGKQLLIYHKKHKFTTDRETLIFCTTCKDKFLIENTKKAELKDAKRIEEETKITIKNENILRQLISDELLQKYSKKHVQLGLTLSYLSKNTLKQFKTFKQSPYHELSKLIHDYNKLINSLNSLTIDGLKKMYDIDLESLNNLDYSLDFSDYTYPPKDYDFIKHDFLLFYENGDIDSLNKISQLVFKRYGNINTTLFYQAIYYLAEKNVISNINDKINEQFNKKDYLTYFIDNNSNVFEKNQRYWYETELAINANVLHDNGVINENNISCFLEVLKNWKFELELQTFESKLTGDENNSITINDVDLMSGIDFEHFTGRLLEKMGYNAEVTKASGDQGADIIAIKNRQKTVIQAKCYANPVSNKAIQEVSAAIKHYNADVGMVVTNSIFTKSATDLASSNDIRLIDRSRLIELMERYGI